MFSKKTEEDPVRVKSVLTLRPGMIVNINTDSQVKTVVLVSFPKMEGYIEVVDLMKWTLWAMGLEPKVRQQRVSLSEYGLYHKPSRGGPIGYFTTDKENFELYSYLVETTMPTHF